MDAEHVRIDAPTHAERSSLKQTYTLGGRSRPPHLHLHLPSPSVAYMIDPPGSPPFLSLVGDFVCAFGLFCVLFLLFRALHIVFLWNKEEGMYVSICSTYIHTYSTSQYSTFYLHLTHATALGFLCLFLSLVIIIIIVIVISVLRI